MSKSSYFPRFFAKRSIPGSSVQDFLLKDQFPVPVLGLQREELASLVLFPEGDPAVQ